MIIRGNAAISSPERVTKGEKNGTVFKPFKPSNIRIGDFIKRFPVEGKGYKNIINLLKLLKKPEKIKKS